MYERCQLETRRKRWVRLCGTVAVFVSRECDFGVFSRDFPFSRLYDGSNF